LPGDDVEIVGYSESRGRVVLGTVTALEVARDLGDAAVGYVRELEAAERPLKLGRPAGLTTIESDDELWAAMDAARRAERPLRMRNVAAISGTFSYSALRGYLAVTHRTWADILDTFSARG
jgi:hypothetical protein